MQVVGSAALLLWGLQMLRHSAAQLFGWRLKQLASGAGNSGIRAFGAGVVMGGALQSSTAAISIGGTMASNRVITTSQGLALALGADAGATLAAQLLGFNWQAALPVLLLAAYLTMRIGRGETARRSAHIMFGLALMVLAVQLIASATEPLRAAPAAHGFFAAMVSEPLVLALVFAFLTLLCHTTLAPVLLIMALAGNEVANLQACFWMVMGVNAAAGIPPLTASLGEPVEFRRVAAGNAVFRLLGVLMLAPIVAAAAAFAGEWGLDGSRATAHFHTFVNVAMGATLLVFTPLAGRWLERALTKVGGDERLKPQYLRSSSGSIAQAISDATRETLRMGDLVSQMLENSTRAVRRGDAALRAQISKLDNGVDFLNREIKLFIAAMDENKMSDGERRRANLLLATITHLEHIGDTIDHGVVSVTRRLQARRVRFSEDGMNEIRDIHSLARENLRGTLGLLVSPDQTVAKHLHQTRLQVERRCEQTFRNHLARVRSGRAESVESSSMHLDWVRDLKRVNNHIAEIAEGIFAVSQEG